MYKTELHLHTSPASVCGRVSPEGVVEHYLKNGYSTIVITNHMTPSLFKDFSSKGQSFENAIEFYLNDYYRAKRHAGDRMNVLLGMEFRNYENVNDYLVYGITDDFLYKAKDLTGMKLRDAINVIRQNGALVFQAHPCRNGITVTDPRYLDGIEAGNFCVIREDRNDISEAWAKKYRLKKVYGSDYHAMSQMCGAGILTDIPITSNMQLLDVLKSQNFKATNGKRIITL